jgi:hypothetical protein
MIFQLFRAKKSHWLFLVERFKDSTDLKVIRVINDLKQDLVCHEDKSDDDICVVRLESDFETTLGLYIQRD